MERHTDRSTRKGIEAAEAWVRTDRGQVQALQKRLIAFSKTSLRSYPWRCSKSPYHILLAEVLLQKTAVAAVLPVFDRLLRSYPSVHKLSLGRLDAIQRIVDPLGLHVRAIRIKKLAHQIVQHHGGEVPRDVSQLLAIPGIGEYTCAAMMSHAFGVRTCAIDSTAARVLSRVCGYRGATKRQDIAFAKYVGALVVRSSKHSEINLSLIDIAALFCRPVPKCRECPLLVGCAYATGFSPS